MVLRYWAIWFVSITHIALLNGQTVGVLKEQVNNLIHQEHFKEAETSLNQVFSLLELSDDSLMYADWVHCFGMLYHKKGEYNKAKESYETALRIRRSKAGPRSVEYAESLYAMGELMIAMSNAVTAAAYFEESAPIYKKERGGRSLEYAAAINALGYCYILKQELDQGKKLCDKAFRIAKKRVKAPHQLKNKIQGALGQYYMMCQKYPEAEKKYKESIAYYSAHFGNTGIGYARELLALTPALINQGKHDVADSLFAEVQAIYDKKNLFAGPDVLYFDYCKSLLHICRGDYEQSELLLADLWEVATSDTLFASDSYFYMEVSKVLAEVYGALEDFKSQEVNLYGTFELRKSVFGQRSPVTAEVYLNYGNYYLRMNRYERAGSFYSNAEAIADDHKHVKLRVNSLQGLGTVHHHSWMLQNDADDCRKAQESYERALRIQERAVGKDNLLYIQVDVARLYLLSMKESGEQLVEEFRKHLDAVKKYSVMAHVNTLSVYSSYLMKEGNYTEALSALELMMQQLKGFRQTQSLTEGKAHLKIGNIMLATNNTEKAHFHLEESLELIKDDVLKVLSVLSEEERKEYWEIGRTNTEPFKRLAYQNKEESPFWGKLAYNNELFVKSLLLTFSTRIQALARKSFNPLVRMVWDETQTIKQRVSGDSNETETIEKVRTPEKELVQLLAPQEGESWVDYKLDWRNVQTVLLPDQAAIEFVSFKEQGEEIYYALLLLPDAEAPQIIPCCTGQELIAANYYETDSLNKLYSLIWEPIELRLNERVKEVYIAPTSLLHNISFYILKDKEQRYLSDKYCIRHVFSTRDVIRQYETENPLPAHPQALLLGGAKFSSFPESFSLADINISRGQSYDFLPASENEVNYISELLLDANWAVTKLVDAKATKENFKVLASFLPTLLHIATHGYYTSFQSEEGEFSSEPNPLMRTGLILTGYNREEIGSRRGVLTAQEISAYDFSNTQLVVLSACNSGRGDIANSDEGVYGLKWAFRLAGAQAMIVTLWDIGDYYAFLFMKEFYQQWLAGESLKNAFALAQRELRKHISEEGVSESEKNWGGFVLIE